MPEQIELELADHVEVGRAAQQMFPQVIAVAEVIRRSFSQDGTLYTFGNGGSAADAQHLTGELIGHYKRDRRPLPAVTLSTDSTTMTCIANDYSYTDVFARQVRALAHRGDVVAAFSTSGLSPNVVAGLRAAQLKGATTILFGGGSGGTALECADYALLSPSEMTPRIQEVHTLFLHVISEYLDAWAAGEDPTV